jgi:Protein of unknown function (DUF3618)
MSEDNLPADGGATAANVAGDVSARGGASTHGEPGVDATRSAVGPAAAPEPTDPDAIRADIERTRSELSDTVNQLSEKLNPKTQATDKVAAAKQAVAERAAKAKAAAPPQVQHAMDQVSAKAAPVARQVSQQAEPYRSKIIGGGVAAAFLLLVLRRRKKKGNEQ